MSQTLTSVKQFSKLFSSLKSTDDPVAQTFLIQPDHCPDSDGCYLTGFDIHFATKDTRFGVNFDLRSVENGVPTRTVLPFSSVHLDPHMVVTSSDGSTATHVNFKAPVYVKANRQYAITVRPDGQVPTYKVFISKLGNSDLITGKTITTNWGDGAFFTSASGAWTPITGVDLKFRVYRAQFDMNVNPSVTMTNDDYEFFTVQTTAGTFSENEEIYKLPASFTTGNVSITAADVDEGDWYNSNVAIAGVSTTFNNDFTSGDTIVLRSRANTSIADVVTLQSVDSNTAMTSLAPFRVGMNDGEGALTPTGVVTSFDASTGELILDNSTAANSNFLFEAGDTIVGTESGATATITTVDNKVINYYQPHLYRSEPSRTNIRTRATFRNSANTQTTEKTVVFGLQNKISEFEAAIYSKSNEIDGVNINKSLVITNELTYNTPVAAPMLDVDSSSIYAFKNEINNDSTNERLANIGSANTKYISKMVTLASGIESDDLQVYLTAYRPPNTSFEVYAKVINDSDPDSPNDRQWTKLGQSVTQEALYSSVDSAEDFKEYRYFIPTSPTVNETNKQPGTANTTTDSTTVAIASASSYYSSGDLIYLGTSAQNYFVGRVNSANATTVTLYEAADRTSESVNHYKVNTDETRAAFRYTDANGSVRVNYYDSQGRKYDNFTKFQIKVVMLGEQTNSTPKMQDIRAIALSA